MGLRVLFFGSDRFSVLSARKLFEVCGSLEVVAPVPSVGVGRRKVLKDGPLREWAKKNEVRVWDAPKTKKLRPDLPLWLPNCDEVEERFDLGVVVSFPFFVPAEIIRAFPKFGAVNVHPSLLPKYRGAAPIQHAIMNQDAETGVTLQRLDPSKFDAGGILKQRKIPIGATDDFEDLISRLGEAGGDLLTDLVKSWNSGKFVEEMAQDESLVSRAPKIGPSDRLIKFNEMRRDDIYARHRALRHTGTLFAKMETCKRFLIHEMTPGPELNETRERVPGELFRGGKNNSLLFLNCRDSKVLRLEKVQVENKKAVRGSDFVNGHLSGKQQSIILT